MACLCIAKAPWLAIKALLPMQDYIDENWKEILQANGLLDFDTLWQLDVGWFEPPNKRRGGWSGVSQTSLKQSQGEPVGIFIKRQENHIFRSIRYPIRGELTFTREFHNLLRYNKYKIPAPYLVYHAERYYGADRRAILITAELSDFISLQDLLVSWLINSPARRQKLAVIYAIARAVHKLHKHRLQHNCLYPKHIFVKQQDSNVEVRLIDLEKTKQRWYRKSACLRDLDTLNRRSPEWSRTDRLRFLLQYKGRSRMDPGVKTLWRQLDNIRRARPMPR